MGLFSKDEAEPVELDKPKVTGGCPTTGDMIMIEAELPDGIKPDKKLQAVIQAVDSGKEIITGLSGNYGQQVTLMVSKAELGVGPGQVLAVMFRREHISTELTALKLTILREPGQSKLSG